MSFEIKERGDAKNIVGVISGTDPALNAREARLASIVSAVVRDISAELGGYVVVSAKGAVRERADEHYGGDSVILQVNTTIPPHPPVPDAGLEAAGGSPRNFPPESSTAAAQTADGSPNADQQPQPQSVPPGQAPLEQAVSVSATTGDIEVTSVSGFEIPPQGSGSTIPVTPEDEAFAAYTESAATSTMANIPAEKATFVSEPEPVIPEPTPTEPPTASTDDAGSTDMSIEQSASAIEPALGDSTQIEADPAPVVPPTSEPSPDTSSAGVPAETVSEPTSPVMEPFSTGTTAPSPDVGE